jgi:hypothetical protein
VGSESRIEEHGERERPKPVEKPCSRCGVECAGRPRARDREGRRLCQACIVELEGQGLIRIRDLRAASTRPADPATLTDGIIPVEGAAPPPLRVPPPPPAQREAGSDARATDADRLLLGLWLAPGDWIREIAARRPFTTVVTIVSVGLAWLLLLFDAPSLALSWSIAANEGDANAAASAGASASASASKLGVRGSWAAVLSLQSFLAFAGALVVWFVGPRWLQLRIRMAGGACDLATARWAYWAASLPVLLIGFIALIVLVVSFASPADPALASSPVLRFLWPVAMALILLGSCWHLWLMATRGLGARPLAAGVLLLGLPGGWYLLQVLLALSIGSPTMTMLARSVQLGLDWGMDWGTDRVQDRAADHHEALVARAMESQGSVRGAESPGAAGRAIDSGTPRVPAQPFAGAFDGNGFEPTSRIPLRFRYPSVWRIEIEPEPQYACDVAVAVHPHGWWVRLRAYPRVDFEGSSMEALDQLAHGIRVQDPELRLVGPLTMLGTRAGVGREYRWRLEGREVRTILFVPERLGSQPLTIVEALLPERADFDERRGVEAIVSTLVIGESPIGARP